MSTKIYIARKIPIALLSTEFMAQFDELVFERAVNVATIWVRGFRPECVRTVSDIARSYFGSDLHPDDYAIQMDLKMRVIMFMALARRASRSPLRSVCCIDAGFQFWVLKHTAYVLPLYPEHSLPETQGSVDFHYQNQTDRPQEISLREWGKRRRFWNMLMDTKDDDGSTMWEDTAFRHHTILLKDNIGEYRCCYRIVREVVSNGTEKDWEHIAFSSLLALTPNFEKQVTDAIDSCGRAG